MKFIKLTLTKFLSKFTSQEDGVTAIEYGLIAALIALLIIGGVTLIGTKLSTAFGSIATSI
jgi:pilus assembly protein Flp/PilA